MDQHINDFFRQTSGGGPSGNFFRVIPLHSGPDVDWETLSEQVPEMCKGWYELAHLTSRDRIEFVRDYWLSKLPYRQGFTEFLPQFFDSLADIGIFITQKRPGDPFDVCLVYALKGDAGFYRGGAPATDEAIISLEQMFVVNTLPEDYKAFLKIHNGFWKTTDCSGILRAEHVWEQYSAFQELLSKADKPVTQGEREIDPKSLIPFYESFGMPFYQCFWTEWYPEGEMGNVYYSSESQTISNTPANPDNKMRAEIMSFPTYLDWLKFYLEQIG